MLRFGKWSGRPSRWRFLIEKQQVRSQGGLIYTWLGAKNLLPSGQESGSQCTWSKELPQDKQCILIYPLVMTSMLKWRQADCFWARGLTQVNYMSLQLERLPMEQRSCRNHATCLVTDLVLFTQNILFVTHPASPHTGHPWATKVVSSSDQLLGLPGH